MTIDDRLRDRGLVLPEPAAPLASYVPFVRAGDLLHVSGQISRDASGGVWRGTLGGDLSIEEGARAAESCALQLLSQVRAACGGDWDRLLRVVKLTGFVASAPGFVDQPKVVNGASDLFVALLDEAGRHARSAIGVSALPLGAAVEVEGVFLLR
ncbi:RidA family protein [Rubellimicrobium sp. CFH 75288]|uniref:RidA family protein n=1 Tax=Rubellimicrobium sp. CFH 75288 TaxID=2697034 RepID=UPI001413010F|nr:RidA family protein [Rubellimicrobium sp. CFH 75288]NAZ37670.1 RidA family protein [Rubellimicrobium sp. CFH 75288]